MHEGWKNIIWGIVIIAVGLSYGGSVFYGEPDTIDYIFDIVGLGLIAFGTYQLIARRA